MGIEQQKTAIHRVKQAGQVSLAAVLLLGAAGGLLRTKWGRPLLMTVAHSMGCPVETDPNKLEASRLTAVKATRGSGKSPDRPALVFTIDGADRSEVVAWATHNRIDCDAEHEGALLTCTNVPSRLIGEDGAPEIGQLAFQFKPGTTRLVNVTALRTGLTPDDASTAYQKATANLREKLGAPQKSSGDGSVALLAETMGISAVTYRYQDYQAEITALNLASRGVTVREHFISARD